MSLLNRPSHGFHSSLVVIYKLLLNKKKLKKETIQALCAPPTLFKEKDPGHIRQTLNTWLKLGLFKENPNGEVFIRKDIAKDHPSPDLLPSAARQFVLKEENNQNFFESENSGSADFMRLLAWSLMQDVWEYDQTSHEEVELHLKKQTKDDFSIFQQNNTRWSGFKAWALFLGFGWTPRYPKSKFEPDPTVAIRDCLPNVFASKKTLDAPP
ncbi:protein DpdG [Akkermansiaceae bacterium]|nr:protein DpdG [Akkermansiaceae bacterium]